VSDRTAGKPVRRRDPAPGPPADVSIVDLYKFLIDQADRVSARRATANSYFLTLHTALVAFVGVLSSARHVENSSVPKVDDFTLVITAFAGCTLAATWWLLLRSYRDLNSAKFKVITEFEEQLPSNRSRASGVSQARRAPSVVEGPLRRVGFRGASRSRRLPWRLHRSHRASVGDVNYMQD